MTVGAQPEMFAQPFPMPGDTPTAEDSAKAIIRDALTKAGVPGLADWFWDLHRQGVPDQQIWLELPEQAEFKARYPAYEALAKKGRAISVAQYQDLERTYSEQLRRYGAPAGFYDQPDDFAALISGEVSPQEFDTRLQDYQTLAYDTDPTVRAELQRIYGIDEGHIFAFVADPERALPLLQRQVGAAQVSGAAQRSGYGGLTQAEGELLSGIAPDQAAQGFGTLVDLQQVLGQLPGEGEAGIDRQQALGAVFQGDATTRQEIARRQARRKATFEQGGGYTSSDKGYSGVG